MMEVTVLVTNGGPHPPDKWASLAGSKIADLIQIDDNSASDLAIQARKAKPRLALDLSDALEPLFATATSDELNRVNSGVVTGRFDQFQPDSYVNTAMDITSSVMGQTMFASHFREPDVLTVVRRILQELILDAMNIERSWAFDAKGL